MGSTSDTFLLTCRCSFSLQFSLLLYHVQYVALAAVVITMIAATATVGYVSAANGMDTGLQCISAHATSFTSDTWITYACSGFLQG